MNIIPYKLRYIWSCARNTRDLAAAWHFLIASDLGASFLDRLRYLTSIYWISLNVDCPHTQQEILAIASAILQAPRALPGVLVEAGCFKGGSTAKLSLLAKISGRRLMVFDSFEGLPDNSESNQISMYGEKANFTKGTYRGTLDEVKTNVRAYGAIDECVFIKGWFDDTMPGFSESVLVAFIDVDLASSTKTCLKYLFPLLRPSGSLFSQDGHLPLVQEVFKNDDFWRSEVGRERPPMQGLGTDKLVRILN